MNQLPEIYKEKRVKSRKDHACSSCGEGISKGGEYVSISGKWDDFQHFKMCPPCHTVFQNWRDIRPGGDDWDGPHLGPGGVSSWLIDMDVDSQELIDVLSLSKQYAEFITRGRS